jgi:hypothetical protein
VAIMSSLKLGQLCQAAGLLPKGIGISHIDGESFGKAPFTHQNIAGVDIFKSVNSDILKPDQPPPINVACLPGTDRRPIRPWQLCSEPEKIAEVALACSLDSIFELAISEGIEVPEPEDGILSLSLFPQQVTRWNAFYKWYTGDEQTNPNPGQGIPTLARVLFAEEWEQRSVNEDPSLLESMIKHSLPVPQICRPDMLQRLRDAEAALNSGASVAPARTSRNNSVAVEASLSLVASTPPVMMFNDSIEMNSVTHGGGSVAGKSMASASTKGMTREAKELQKIKEQQAIMAAEKALADEAAALAARRAAAQQEILDLREELSRGDNYSSLQQAYEASLGTVAGISCRVNMICRHLNAVLECRRLTVSRYAWMPGASSTEEHYMFPRMGIITPHFELPPRRITPFPSRSKDAYTHLELQNLWFSERELDEDDELMRQAEIKGRAMRVYNDWLAKHEERVLECRSAMAQEDWTAGFIRATNIIIEQKIQQHQVKVFKSVESDDENDAHDEVKTSYSGDEHSRPVSSVGTSRPFSGYSIKSAASDGDEELATSSSPRVPPKMKRALSKMQSVRRLGNLPSSSNRVEEAVATVAEMKKFMFSSDLPKDYWYIFEESVDMQDGSGLMNGDEIEDMRLEQLEVSRKAAEAAIKFENFLAEEKRRRDKEEAERLRKEEQDRRMAENVERRRKLREMFEEIKHDRIRKAEEERVLKMIAEEERLQQLERSEAVRKAQKDAASVVMRMEAELAAMANEEVITRELCLRIEEIKCMEHEDILSFVGRHYSVQEEKAKQSRLKELQELYVPFEPFRFRKERVKLPRLHRMLQDEEDFYLAGDDDSVDSDAPSIGSKISNRFRIAADIGSGDDVVTVPTLHRSASTLVSEQMQATKAATAKSPTTTDAKEIAASDPESMPHPNLKPKLEKSKSFLQNTEASYEKRSERYKILYESTRQSTVDARLALLEEARQRSFSSYNGLEDKSLPPLDEEAGTDGQLDPQQMSHGFSPLPSPRVAIVPLSSSSLLARNNNFAQQQERLQQQEERLAKLQQSLLATERPDASEDRPVIGALRAAPKDLRRLKTPLRNSYDMTWMFQLQQQAPLLGNDGVTPSSAGASTYFTLAPREPTPPNATAAAVLGKQTPAFVAVARQVTPPTTAAAAAARRQSISAGVKPPSSPSVTGSAVEVSSTIGGTNAARSLSMGDFSFARPPSPELYKKAENGWNEQFAEGSDVLDQIRTLQSQDQLVRADALLSEEERKITIDSAVRLKEPEDKQKFPDQTPGTGSAVTGSKPAPGTKNARSKKAKMVLSSSADLIHGIENSKTAMEFSRLLSSQRNATFASLTSIAHIDANGLPQRKKAAKTTSSSTFDQVGGGRGTDDDIETAAGKKAAAEMRQKQAADAKMKKELHELGIVQENVIDVRTKVMAQRAAEAAIHLQSERAKLSQFVAAGAGLGTREGDSAMDPFYLEACAPGLKDQSSLEAVFQHAQEGTGSPSLQSFLSFSLQFARDNFGPARDSLDGLTAAAGSNPTDHIFAPATSGETSASLGNSGLELPPLPSLPIHGTSTAARTAISSDLNSEKLSSGQGSLPLINTAGALSLQLLSPTLQMPLPSGSSSNAIFSLRGAGMGIREVGYTNTSGLGSKLTDKKRPDIAKGISAASDSSSKLKRRGTNAVEKPSKVVSAFGSSPTREISSPQFLMHQPYIPQMSTDETEEFIKAMHMNIPYIAAASSQSRSRPGSMSASRVIESNTGQSSSSAILEMSNSVASTTHGGVVLEDASGSRILVVKTPTQSMIVDDDDQSVNSNK